MLIPFALGIGIADACLCFIENHAINMPWKWAAALSCLLLIMLFMACVLLYLRRNYAFVYRFFGLTLFAFIFLLGMACNGIAWLDKEVKWWTTEAQYTGVILQKPQRNSYYTQVRVWVIDGFEGTKKQKIGRTVQLSLVGLSQQDTLFVGQSLVFYTQLSKPHNAGNPDEFDYAGYLFRQGVVGQAVVPRNKYNTLLHTKSKLHNIPFFVSLRIEALRWQNRLHQVYVQTGLRGEQLAVLSALTLGDKSTLSKSLRRRYSDAGASHLLALSGLHLGILMTLLNFLFLRWGRFTPYRWLGVGVALLFIWCFALLAGLPASLLRAATMYTLLVLGSSLQQNGFSLNSLFFSAFVMLFSNPFYLFDVGFQLSFIAMLGILLLQPRLQILWKTQYWAWRFLWQMTTVSFSAQIATAPLVAYYFNTVALYALPASLLLIPLTTLIVWGATMLLLFSFSATISEVLAQFINYTINLQHYLLDTLNKLPGAVGSYLYPSEFQVIAFYAMLLLLLAYVAYRRPRILSAMLLLGCTIVVNAVYRIQKKDTTAQLIFYNQRNNPAAQLIYSASCSYLLTPPNNSAYIKTRQIATSFWRRTLKKPPLWIAAPYHDEQVQYANGLLYAPGVTLLMLGDETWNNSTASTIYTIDYLYLYKGYKGSLIALATMFRPKCVVLDTSLGEYYTKNYRDECDKLGWKYYAIKEKGALKIALK